MVVRRVVHEDLLRREGPLCDRDSAQEAVGRRRSPAHRHPQKKGLEALTKNVREFFREFAGQDLQNLSMRAVPKALDRHKLAVDDLLDSYVVPLQGAGLPKS